MPRLSILSHAFVVVAILVSSSPLRAAAVDDMNALYERAMTLYRAGNFKAALPAFQKVLDQAQMRYGPNSPLLSIELNNLGEVNRRLGRYPQAEALIKRAIKIEEDKHDPADPGLATSLNNLALLYRTQGRLAEAEPLYERSLALFNQALGPNSPDVAKSLSNLAALYSAQGRPDDARPLLERAVAIALTTLGPDSAVTRLYQSNLRSLPARAATLDGGADAGATRAALAQGRMPPPPQRLVARQPEAELPPPPTAASAAAPPVPAPRPDAVATSKHKAVATPAPRAVTAPSQPVVAMAAPRPPATLSPVPPATALFGLHLETVREARDVASEWSTLTADVPSLARLPLLPPQAVELPGRGTFYRLVAGRFVSRANAQAACAEVKDRGRYCEVVSR